MKDITVKLDTTIRQAMKALDKTGEKCLLVIDENRKLLGTCRRKNQYPKHDLCKTI